MQVNNLWFVVGALVLLLVGGVFYTLRDRAKLSNSNTQLNAKLMEANLEVGKAHTQFGDAQKYSGELEDQLAKEIKTNKELLTQYGVLKAKFDATGQGSNTVVVSGPTIEVPKSLNLEPNSLYLSKTSEQLQLIGRMVGDSFKDMRLSAAYALHTEPELHFDFNYALHLQIAGQIVQSITESGAVNNYIRLWEVDDKGKKTGNQFKLESYEVVVEDQRSNHFFAWAPHLDLGVLGGYNNGLQLGASVGFSVMGYGKTENDLTWRFIRPGLTIAKNWGVDLAPILWRLPLPLLSNVWVAPYISWTPLNNWGVGGMINLVM